MKTTGTAFALALCAGLASTATSAHAQVRSYDGTGNNVANPEWGANHAQLLREASGSHYADGMWQMAGTTRPSARDISNVVGVQTAPLNTNSGNLSSMFWQWGQFIDHDISLTHTGSEFAPITGSDPSDVLGPMIPFTRSAFDPATGSSLATPRQQENSISAFLDASMVYGSDSSRASTLRANDGTGRLATSGGGQFMPLNTAGLANANDTGQFADSELYAGGDIRANEVTGLAAMHTLFVREHNRLADEISTANPTMSGEQVFEQARAIVGGQIQAITYNEFLPALLGSAAPSLADASYDASVDATIANSFSTAAYRLGHTMLNSQYKMFDADGSEHSYGHVDLRDGFFNAPEVLETAGLDPIFRGLAWQQANEMDTQVVDDVRNFLFGAPGAGGLDLLSMNIQRGRDHGLADYNTLRQDFGLAPITNFAEITSDPTLAAQLQSLYGSVNDIDPWIGLMAEDKLSGAAVGETLAAIVADQFTRLRDGDRFLFMFDSNIDAALRDDIMGTTLAEIIMRNTDIGWLQCDVFRFIGEPIPAPASLALVGLGGLAASRRRRS
ncbi:MAG: peroxidase family protein [Planctomycetota bacterium]